MMTYITVKDAAAQLGITPRRVQALIRDGQLEATKVGEGRRGLWLIDPISLGNRLLVQEAQKAWDLLGISKRLWGEWWLADPDEGFDTEECPKCGDEAYGIPLTAPDKYAGWTACPVCGWTDRVEIE